LQAVNVTISPGVPEEGSVTMLMARYQDRESCRDCPVRGRGRLSCAGNNAVINMTTPPTDIDIDIDNTPRSWDFAGGGIVDIGADELEF